MPSVWLFLIIAIFFTKMSAGRESFENKFHTEHLLKRVKNYWQRTWQQKYVENVENNL